MNIAMGTKTMTRRVLVLAALAAMLLPDMAPAMAQMKLRPGMGQMVRPRAGNRPPRVMKVKPRVDIYKDVMRSNPGSKVLKIKPKPGGGYSVVIRKGNTLRNVDVDP